MPPDAADPVGSSAWTQLSPGVTGDFRAIAGAGSELWALGDTDFNARKNVIARWDGETWTEVVRDTGFIDLFAVGADVWGVGYNGKIARWDGAAFAPIASGVTSSLSGVWGASSADLWIVALNATALLHWDGAAVTSVTVGTTPLRAVRGTASDDVWAVGGAIHHFDGATWTPVPATLPGTLTTVHAVARDLAWVSGGGTTLRWDGTAWAIDPGLDPALSWTFAGHARDDVWAMSASPRMLMHWDGAAWTAAVAPERALSDLWVAPDGALWGAGTGDVLMRRDPCGWVYTSGAVHHSRSVTGLWASGTSAWMIGGPYGGLSTIDECSLRVLGDPNDFPYGLGGSGPDDVWIVGAYGLTVRWNGAALETPPQPGPNGPLLDGVWAGTPTDAWAVGGEGTIERWDGQAWSSVASPTTRWLTDVTGNASGARWAVGEAGTILAWDGAAWSMMEGPTRAWLGAVWTTGDEAWAVGEAGTILHLVDGAWAQVPSGTAATLLDIDGRAADDIWAVGDGGTALHYDGIAWRAVATDTTANLTSVAVAQRTWVGGSGGLLMWR